MHARMHARKHTPAAPSALLCHHRAAQTSGAGCQPGPGSWRERETQGTACVCLPCRAHACMHAAAAAPVRGTLCGACAVPCIHSAALLQEVLLATLLCNVPLRTHQRMDALTHHPTASLPCRNTPCVCPRPPCWGVRACQLKHAPLPTAAVPAPFSLAVVGLCTFHIAPSPPRKVRAPGLYIECAPMHGHSPRPLAAVTCSRPSPQRPAHARNQAPPLLSRSPHATFANASSLM